MYKPNGATKKLLSKHGSVVYVYRDGVVIRSNRKILSRGIEFTKNVVDVYPCEIPIYYSNSKDGAEFHGVITYHNPTSIINGIRSIEIYLDNSSESLRRNGASCDTVTLLTIDRMRINNDMLTFRDGGRSYEITVNNSEAVSATSWEKSDYYESVIVHDKIDKV